MTYGGVKKFARQRVQHHVDPLAIGFSKDTRLKGRISGVENTVSWDIEIVHQILDLLVVAHRGEELCTNHSADLYGCYTNTTTS